MHLVSTLQVRILPLTPIFTTNKFKMNSETFFRKAILFSVVGIVLFTLLLAGFPLSNNDAGNRQVVQQVDGHLFVRFNPGWYYSGFFAKVETYPNNVTIQVAPEDRRSDAADYKFVPNQGTFAEGDRADLSHTVKWDLPNDETTMLELHTTYNNIENLATTTLAQFQKQTASYSCQRMTSEEHYSGGESQLNQYFQDQLRNGQVLLVTETKTAKQTDGSTKTYIEVNERWNADSTGYLRNQESIQDILNIGMKPSFASIDKVTYDGEIYEKLKKKIEFAAEEANSKQELVAAQQKAETAKVKGQQLVEETKAREEAAKIEAVIRAEKEAAVAAENLKRDEKIAASKLALKKAEAEGDKLKVQAGLSPLEQATIDKETAIGVAKALAGPDGIKFPSIVASGSGGGGGALQTIELKMLNDLARDMAKK